jgi:hypothetical protein
MTRPLAVVARNDVPTPETSDHLRAMAAKYYRDAMAKCGVPEHMHDHLVNYLVHYRVTGSFLRAVLDNNLRLAIGQADEVNKGALAEIVRFLVDVAPAYAWGSERAVDAWIAKGGNS